MNWERYAEKVPYFADLAIPSNLEDILKKLNREFSLIDLGCGDGTFLWALHNKGLLENANRIVGVDISKKRIKRSKQYCPFVEGIVSDVQNLSQIHDNAFDIVISSQVIEHVPDDSQMLKEVHRILKPIGYFYISTVIKKWYGFWIYWNNGFKLDPTHLREYKSKEEFINLLENHGFEIIQLKIRNLKFPVVDLFLRVLFKIGMINLSSDFYLKHKKVKRVRGRTKLKIVGYKKVESILMKRK